MPTIVFLCSQDIKYNSYENVQYLNYFVGFEQFCITLYSKHDNHHSDDDNIKSQKQS